MNSRDQISKASFMLVEHIKRSTALHVHDLVKSGNIRIDSRALPGLMTIIMSVVEQGYHAGYKDFMKTVDKALDESAAAKQKLEKQKKIRRLLGIFGKK